MKAESVMSETPLITLDDDEDEVEVLSPPPLTKLPSNNGVDRKDCFATIIKRDYSNRQPNRIFIFNPKNRTALPKCDRCKKVFLSKQSAAAHAEKCQALPAPTSSPPEQGVKIFSNPGGRRLILTRRNPQGSSLPMPPLKRGISMLNEGGVEATEGGAERIVYSSSPADSQSELGSIRSIVLSTKCSMEERRKRDNGGRALTPPLPILPDHVVTSEMDQAVASTTSKRKPCIIENAQFSAQKRNITRKKRWKQPSSRSRDTREPKNDAVTKIGSQSPSETEFLETLTVTGRLPQLEGNVCCSACIQWLSASAHTNFEDLFSRISEDLGMTQEVAEFMGLESQQMFQCSCCQLLYRHLYAWNIHMQSKHPMYTSKDLLWKCVLCPENKGTICYTQEMLSLHQKLAHSRKLNGSIKRHLKSTTVQRRKVKNSLKTVRKEMKKTSYKNVCPFPGCTETYKFRVKLDDHWWRCHRACPNCEMPCPLPLIYRLHSLRCYSIPRSSAQTTVVPDSTSIRAWEKHMGT